MKIEKGMYFRAYGKIDKVRSIVRKSSLYEDSGIYGEKYGKFIIGSKIIDEVPHSHNIIGLIEVGDYVNGYLVTDVYRPTGNEVFRIEIERDTLKGHIIDNTNNIKSIVTKEQFESVEYDI